MSSVPEKLEILSAIVGSEEDPDAKLLLATTLFSLVLQNLVRSADKPQLLDDATAALSEIVCAAEVTIRMWGGLRPPEGRHAVNLAIALLEMNTIPMRYEVEKLPAISKLYRELATGLNRTAELLDVPLGAPGRN
jgi:hypothetical protein